MLDTLPCLDGYKVFDVQDPAEMDERSLVTRRFPSPNNVLTYTLRDPALRRALPVTPLTRLATRLLDDIQLSHVADRFGIATGIEEPGLDYHCFGMVNAGALGLASPDGGPATAGGKGLGLAYRGRPGTRILTGDGTSRTNLWIGADRIDAALAACLGGRVVAPLVFVPSLDWTRGAGPALQRLVLHFADELTRPAGLASNKLALSAFIDLFIHTALRGFAHTYSERLERGRDGPAPQHLRRAEQYLRTHADQPVLMQDVADAASCSVRALQLAFRRFRDTTPHAALGQVRLERSREALVADDAPIATIARRFGFTHSGRFSSAYARRFGELPSDTRRGRKS